MKKTVSIVALLAVIIVCLSIVAKNLFIEEDDGYRSSRERAMIKKFDKDGDGKLSREERRAIYKAEEKRKFEFIKKFDKDGDGKLSREEEKAADAAMKVRKLEAVKSAKGDGSKSKKKLQPLSLERK